MLGSIIGDIVGSIYEFNNIKTKEFPLWGKNCAFTDDSVLTVATADWLIRSGGVGDYYLKYAELYPYPMGGYGNGFNSWVMQSQPGMPAKPYGSCGNGSAMRVGPVGWAGNTKEEIFAMAGESAVCTHNHPEGIKGAQATAMAIFLARQGMTVRKIRETIEQDFGYDLSMNVETLQDLYSWEGVDGRSGATCQGTVPEAMICAFEATDFEDAIRNAVSIGGDSDTLACITGSIAEALFGIPRDIYEKGLSYLDDFLRKTVLEFEERFGANIIDRTKSNTNPKSTNNMPIQRRIDEIIAHRKGTGAYEGQGRLDVIEKRLDFFKKLEKALAEYESFRKSALSQIDSKQGEYYVLSAEDPSLKQRLEDTATKNVAEQVKTCIDTCNRLYHRFNRDSINISVVGRARQGKSTLLQRISGLESSVIPASDGGDCTGTTSIICNEPGTDTAHATVVFYSKEEILQQLRDYIKEMKQNWVIPSFETIKSAIEPYIDTPEKRTALKAGMTSAEQSLFMHFCKYINHFELYTQLIGDDSRQLNITENQISQYVAQRDEAQRPIFNFLAVKEVRIFKEFNYADAGKIVLVDTIGLGDTALGIEKKMLQTLHNESDAAFLMRFPASTGDHWAKEDDELYQLIANEMGAEMLEKWLFLVINCKRKGETNNAAVTAVKQDLSEKVLRMAGIYETNCYDKEDVINTLLIPALDYLSTNLDAVDCRLMEQANKQFDDCYQVYLQLCNKVSELITGSAKVMGELESFGITKFEELFPLITEKIGIIYEEYRDNSVIPSGKIKKVFEEHIGQLYSFVPPRKEILRRLNAHFEGADDIFKSCLKEMSIKIAANFETINTIVLRKMQDMLKRRVAFELHETALWKVFPLVTSSNEKPTLEWLRSFADEKLKNDFPLLYEAVDFILNYEISVSDLLDYEVEHCLMVITPDDPSCKPLDMNLVIKDGVYIPLESQAKAIQNALVNRLPDVDEMMKESLSIDIQQSNVSLNVHGGASTKGFSLMTRIPNHSLFARIRKFRNKLFMTKAAERELRSFYMKHASFIWGADFFAEKKIHDSQKQFTQWKDTMSALCSKASFTFELPAITQQ